MKRNIRVIGIVFLFVLSFFLLQHLVEPKYMTNLVEGSFTREYYQETEGHEVIFIGDCEVYANISPMVLYEEEGITSYVRGNSQQLLWQSYGILKETLKYETPKVVVFNVGAMRYGEPVSEAYNRLFFDGMKWSREKLETLSHSMTEKENLFYYLFPILRYHSRITELTKEDFTYFFKSKKITHNGFLINQEVKPVGTFPTERKLGKDDFDEICYKYLDQMRILCEEHGITFVLMKAPSLYPYWPDVYEQRIQEYADKYHLDYYNFKEKTEKIGIDYSQDTYDGGLHLNLSGATKLSTYFSHILKEKYQLKDGRKDDKIKEIYDKKLKLYREEIENR